LSEIIVNDAFSEKKSHALLIIRPSRKVVKSSVFSLLLTSPNAHLLIFYCTFSCVSARIFHVHDLLFILLLYHCSSQCL